MEALSSRPYFFGDRSKPLEVGGSLRGRRHLLWSLCSDMAKARNSQPTSEPVSKRDLMLRAVSQSKSCKSEPGKVSPMVGAVIARDGRIIGEAFRGELAPGEHAEYTLLERKLSDEMLAGSVLFTTLEPCTAG